MHMTMSQVTHSPGMTTANSLPLNTWYDSSKDGWYQPSSGNTYPTGATRQTRDL